eukprot:s4865_g1.t1
MSGQSVLPLLATQAKEWRTQVTAQKVDVQVTPLRSWLMQTLVKELQARVEQLAQCPPTDALWKAALERGTITKEGAWNYLTWNVKEAALQTSSQPPMPMSRLQKQLQHLQELVMDADNVQKFQSLKPGDKTTTWMLQVGLRSDETWMVMKSLTGLTCWALLGASLKQHSHSLSRPAQQLAQLTGFHAPPGAKGKGKGKTKQPQLP